MTSSPGNGPPRSLRPSRTRRARAGRMLLWIGAALVVIVALLSIGALWLGEHLSEPNIKAKIQTIAHDEAGLTIDYDGLEVSPFSGVRARFLRVAQPAKFKAAAEDFVRIDDLEVRARALALASKEPTIDVLRIGQIALTLVRDEHGATTLSELFPNKPKPPASAPEKPSKLSQSLSDLPKLAVRKIAIASIAAKLIDLRAGAAARTTTLASLGVDGAIHSEPDSLRGTDLKIEGAPSLRLEIHDGERAQFADLALAFAVRADAARSLAIHAHTALGRQNLLPQWPNASELLNLEARLLFDAASNRTSISVSDFRGLGNMVRAALGIEVFDTEPKRILANGTANLDVERLPIDLAGVSLQDLKLALEAKKFSWQGDRIAGAIDWRGVVRSVAYDREELGGRIDDASLEGHGSFEGPSGGLEASVKFGELHAHTPAATAKLENLSVSVNGRTKARASGGQTLDAQIEFALQSADATTPTGQTLAIDDMAFRGFIGGTIADFSAKRLPKLQSKLAIGAVAAAEGGKQSLRMTQLAMRFDGADLAADERSPSGAKGDASLTLELPSARVFDGPLPAPDERAPARKHKLAKRSASLAIDDVKLQAELPLSLAQAKGQLSLASLVAHDDALKSLELDFDLQNPLQWSSDRAGPAQARVTGHIAGVRASGSRGVLEDVRLIANRLDKDRYRGELNTSTSSIVANGRNVPGKITTELHADASPAAGSFDLSAAVRGAKGAAIDLKSDASFAGADQRLRYDLELSAEKLDAFATLIYGVAPSAAPVKVEGARFHASATGEFTGVLKAQRGGTPSLVADPIASARGKQSFELELSGLDYHATDRSLVIPALAFKLDSTHGDQGAGSAAASFRAGSVEYSGDGKSLRLEGLDQTVSAKFDRAPDRGVVDVVSNLQLGSASQSLLPAYPIAGLRFSTHVQIDRLRSLFLREFAIANDVTGTELHADGALELR
ncbi:MAG TPA: AsmA family protein, partial [Polyangiales bacterium]